MNSPSERRSNAVVVAVGILFMAAAIGTLINCANPNTTSIGKDVGGTVQAHYVGSGPTFYFAVDVNGERVQVSVSEEEFEFYKVGDYFVIKK